MESTLDALRAAAEPTRLRLLALLADGDLTVSELVHILGQSQPRISRHLKVLTAAGLITRTPEGSWVFHRLSVEGEQGRLARKLVDLAPVDDEVFLRDRDRLNAIKRDRAKGAEEYFARNAGQWDQVRSLQVDEALVEEALRDAVPASGVDRLLDLGTGTGRILEVLADRISFGQGVDHSRHMLAMARARLDAPGLHHCQVRQADLTQLPFQRAGFDLVTIYQVLHFLDDPVQAVEVAADMLKPGGRLVIVDFAPHEEEHLRRDHQHRRLGFRDDEVVNWCQTFGLKAGSIKHLAGTPLTVTLWCADKPQPAQPPAQLGPRAQSSIMPVAHAGGHPNPSQTEITS